MAVRKMVCEARAGEPGVETVPSYAGHDGPLYMETTHVGLVLRLYEHNWYDDSDFMALVWNPETGAPDKVLVATTRGWTYPNSATVDATPEVVAAYEAWNDKVAAESAARTAARLALLPHVGKTCKVVKGRKVPVGTTGVSVWYGRGKSYGGRPGADRVGIKDANGTVHWTAASNVVVEGAS